MNKLSIIFLAALAFCAACGGGTPAANSGGNSSTTAAGKLEIKAGGKDLTLDEKSGAVNLSEMNFTAPGKPPLKTSLHTIYLANYEIDASAPGWMRKPLTAADQIRVDLELTGADGTTKDSPFQVGSYNAQAVQTLGVRMVKIITFADGKQTETRFDNLMGYGSKNAAGEVKITSVTADTVSGEISLTEGDKSVKGTFNAKLASK